MPPRPLPQPTANSPLSRYSSQQKRAPKDPNPSTLSNCTLSTSDPNSSANFSKDVSATTQSSVSSIEARDSNSHGLNNLSESIHQVEFDPSLTPCPPHMFGHYHFSQPSELYCKSSSTTNSPSTDITEASMKYQQPSVNLNSSINKNFLTNGQTDIDTFPHLYPTTNLDLNFNSPSFPDYSEINPPFTPPEETYKFDGKVSLKAQSDKERPDYHIKIVCVGDGGCGKTSLMLTYTIGNFPTTYVPTVFENYLTSIRAPDGKLVELALWDTAGQEEYDRLRVLSYPEVNILLICFGIDSPTSLENVIDKWVPEVAHFCPDIPYILIGLKTDLRTEAASQAYLRAKNIQCITKEQGQSVAKRVGARKYLECSARMSWGVSTIFSAAIDIVFQDHFGFQSQQPVQLEPNKIMPAKLSNLSAKKSKNFKSKILYKTTHSDGGKSKYGMEKRTDIVNSGTDSIDDEGNSSRKILKPLPLRKKRRNRCIIL